MVSDLPKSTRQDNEEAEAPDRDLTGVLFPATNMGHPSVFPHLQFDKMRYGEGPSDCKGLYIIGPTPCRELLVSVFSDSVTSPSWMFGAHAAHTQIPCRQFATVRPEGL